MAQQAANTVQTAVYEELKRGIMALILEPGREISTQEMATRLNVSRTPVREAFLRLQREGLVEAIPQRSTIISRIDMKRVEQERFIRESLELAVVEPFLENCKSGDFELLRGCIAEQAQCIAQQRYVDCVHSDNRMHKIFFAVANQTLAWDTVNSVIGHYNRIRVLAGHLEHTLENTLVQHGRIVDLLEQRKADAARAELSDHLRKLFWEKNELIKRYPSYFTTGEEPTGPRIGHL